MALELGKQLRLKIDSIDIGGGGRRWNSGQGMPYFFLHIWWMHFNILTLCMDLLGLQLAIIKKKTIVCLKTKKRPFP